MGDVKKMSLLEEMEREAREIEKELEQHPELDDIQVTEEMDAALFAKIQAYEESKEKVNIDDSVEFSEEIAPEIPREEKKKIPYRKKSRKRYVIIGIAAVLALVLGSGLIGVGNKAYWKEVFDQDYGKEDLNVIEVEDMEDIQSVDGESGTIFDSIETELGVSIVRIKYLPKDMYFSRMEIADNMQQAIVFYEYGEEIIRYMIYLNSRDSSRVEATEDEKVNEYTVLVKRANSDFEIIVEEYQVPEYNEYRRIANFEYKGIHYQLKGILEKEEFDKILQNLKIL